MQRRMGPESPTDDKCRHLRRLYRQTGAEKSTQVRPEYERLFPNAELPLDHILASAWFEARELAGWTYDTTAQCWRRADGSRVLDDTGEEWRHL